jgi:DNA-directed RNA polymerase specialized sigma24 family protein
LALQASNIYRELRQLRTSSRKLIALLIQNPPVPYAEISARLGIPVGRIGPLRARCLQRLRQSGVLRFEDEEKRVGLS